MDAEELEKAMRPMVFRAFGRTNIIDVGEDYVRYDYKVDRDEVIVDTEQLLKLARMLERHKIKLTLDSDRAQRVSITIWV